MSTRCSTRWPRTPPASSSRRNSSGAALALALIAAPVCIAPQVAQAQIAVFDVKNHIENALTAARQLESLTNQAAALANQARALAASPYSHLAETTQTLREISDLARSVRGVAADIQGVQRDFDQLYPAAVQGLDPAKALQQSQARNTTARQTAQDLARTAAELEQLSQSRTTRLQGAVTASQNASGQTAAIQSSTQVLAVLSEDLGSMRTILLAQSRLMAEEAARKAAERDAADEARRQFWGHETSLPAAPDFDPAPRRNRY